MQSIDTKKMLFMYHSKTNSYNKKVSYAINRIEKWLKLCSNPYIAFSTGKDSTVIFDIVRRIKKDITAVYFDAGCSFPESGEMLSNIENIIIFKTDEPLIETLKRYDLFGSNELNMATMQSTVWGPIKRLIDEYSFNGVLLGLRMEESYGRKMNAKKRGPIYQYKCDGLWACQPIYDWLYEDVWAYIFSNNLSYCDVYDKMWTMPKQDQRLSYWAGETKRCWGRYAWLKKNYPDLFNKLAQEIPEVRCFV